jgi:hypothetical protein
MTDALTQACDQAAAEIRAQVGRGYDVAETIHRHLAPLFAEHDAERERLREVLKGRSQRNHDERRDAPEPTIHAYISTGDTSHCDICRKLEFDGLHLAPELAEEGA